MMIDSPNMIAYGVGIGLVCSVLAYFFYTLGLGGVSASNAAILSEIEPVVATMIGIFVFKESHSALKIIGIFLVLLSIVILNINFKKKEDKKLY